MLPKEHLFILSVIAEYQKLLELRASKIEKLESEIRDTIHNRTPRSVAASKVTCILLQTLAAVARHQNPSEFQPFLKLSFIKRLL